MKNKTMSFSRFVLHMEECDLTVNDYVFRRGPAQIVIRGLDGDYALAAVHREGDRLVFDLGLKLKE